jgi:predicted TIM-barrel fold metal-dependent hydrolase
MTYDLLPFFDCGIMLGPWEQATPGSPQNAAELTSLLQRCGIGEALVYSSLATLYNPPLGNEELLGEIAGHPGLHPCWVLIPDQTEEMPPAEQVVERMMQAGVRAARVFPLGFHVSLAEWSVGPLFRLLAAHRIPLFLDWGHRNWSQELINWDELRDLCAGYPDLPIILVRPSLSSDRRLFPLMARFPNLYIENSYYVVHRGIELICRRFGAERVLFGTGLPQRAPGPAITALSYSGVSRREKELVAGDNLRRLLGEVR